MVAMQDTMHTNDGAEPILQSSSWGLFMRCGHPRGACEGCKAGRWPLIKARPGRVNLGSQTGRAAVGGPLDFTMRTHPI